MSNTGGQFTQAGKLLLGNYLVLGAPQFFKGGLEFAVLFLQVLGQQLDQVESLNFQSVEPKYFYGGRHVRHLVVTADLYLGFQIATGHPAHPGRQHSQSTDQNTSHQQPGNQGGDDYADKADDQQERAAGEYRLNRSLSGCLGAGLGRSNQIIHFGNQAHGGLLIVMQEFQLPLSQLPFLLQQGKACALGHAQLRQPPENRGDVGMDGGILKSIKVQINAVDGRFKPLLKRLQRRRFSNSKAVSQQLGRAIGIGLQFRQQPVLLQFFGGEVNRPRIWVQTDFPIARNGIKELVIKSRDQSNVQISPDLGQLFAQGLALFALNYQFRPLVSDSLDVGSQEIGAVADGLKSKILVSIFFSDQQPFQGDQFNVQGVAGFSDVVVNKVQFINGLRGNYTGSSGNQTAAILGHFESSYHLRYAFIVDMPLGHGHSVKREPANNAGGNGKGHDDGEGCIKLCGNLPATLHQARQQLGNKFPGGQVFAHRQRLSGTLLQLSGDLPCCCAVGETKHGGGGFLRFVYHGKTSRKLSIGRC